MEEFDINKESSDIEKTLADVMKIEKQKKEDQLNRDELEESSLRIAKQLQTLNDTIQGGIRSANLRENRNTICFNEADSLDADNPFLMDFEVISETTKIVSIKLSFKIKNFRAYSKSATEKEAVTSGPSSAASSASGGGETPTSSSVSTPSGGGATSGAKGSASGGGSTSGAKTTPSGGGSTSGAGGADTRTSSASATADTTTQILSTIAHDGGYLINQKVDHTSSGRYHTHTVTIPNHYHSTPNHTHPSHTHTTPNHTHPNHTHSTPNHTHPAHTHTVTIASHTHNIPHTHSVPAHSHNITFGIHEEETSPTIQVFISRDNGLTYSLPLGSYTEDQNLDITRFIDAVGDKVIKFTSDVRCRISAMVLLKLDIKART